MPLTGPTFFVFHHGIQEYIMQFDWSAIWPAIPLLLEGAKM
ncbi:MAG: glutamine ABC transporter permease GlnP, partial [Enterobacter sp.]|nr:glutamine ABC transporter permease GlnP [Enterobacter sp.]